MQIQPLWHMQQQAQSEHTVGTAALFYFPMLQTIGACKPGLFQTCVLTSREPDAKTPHMDAYAYTDVRIAYSVHPSNKIRFPKLRIKCGVAKSCPGTHTALQAPMLQTTSHYSIKLVSPILKYTLKLASLGTRPLKKKGLVNGGSIQHCRMLGILLIAAPCKACRVFHQTRHTYKHSIFPAWCLATAF